MKPVVIRIEVTFPTPIEEENLAPCIIPGRYLCLACQVRMVFDDLTPRSNAFRDIFEALGICLARECKGGGSSNWERTAHPYRGRGK
jgi:hypothetical protein